MSLLTQPVAVPLINGAAYSFAHIRLKIAGLEFNGGFKAIKYSRKREREKLESNSPDPVAKSLGMNRYEASVEVYTAWWKVLKDTIKNQIGPGYGDQFFDTFVSYSALGFEPMTDVIVGCTLDTTDIDHSAGIPGLTRMIDLTPLKIYFDRDDDLQVPLAQVA